MLRLTHSLTHSLTLDNQFFLSTAILLFSREDFPCLKNEDVACSIGLNALPEFMWSDPPATDQHADSWLSLLEILYFLKLHFSCFLNFQRLSEIRSRAYHHYLLLVFPLNPLAHKSIRNEELLQILAPRSHQLASRSPQCSHSLTRSSGTSSTLSSLVVHAHQWSSNVCVASPHLT